jgi:CspA family cold shock protein
MAEKELFFGTVVWFNRGYGYVKPDLDLRQLNNGREDFFVHYTQIVSEPNTFKTLTAGQKVSFVIGANKNGPQAESVVVLADPKLGE